MIQKNKRSTELLFCKLWIRSAESYYIYDRILEREDRTVKSVKKQEFEKLLDYYNKDSLHYLIKQRYYQAIWQPADDLQEQDNMLLEFHQQNPDKSGLST